MIVEAAVFIERDDEHGFRPITSRVAELFIDLFDQGFALSDVVEGMHGIAGHIVAPGIIARLDESVIREAALIHIVKKVIHVLEILR